MVFGGIVMSANREPKAAAERPKMSSHPDGTCVDLRPACESQKIYPNLSGERSLFPHAFERAANWMVPDQTNGFPSLPCSTAPVVDGVDEIKLAIGR